MIQESPPPNNAPQPSRFSDWMEVIARVITGRRLGMAGTGVAVVLVVSLGVLAWSSVRSLAAVERDLSEIMSSIQDSGLSELTGAESYASLIASIKDVEDRLGGLRRSALVAAPLQWVPGVGSRVTNATQFLELADHFARGTRRVLEAYTPAVQALNNRASQADLATLRTSMESAGPLLADAQDELEKALQVRARLATPTGLGDRADSALALMDQYIPLLDLASVVAKDTPELIGEVLDLRETVSQVRNFLTEPSALLAQPRVLEAAFRDVQDRALRVQAWLEEVRALVATRETRVEEVVDAALQTSVLLANLGEALGRFAGVADGVFTLGILTTEAAALMGDELPRIRGLIQAAQEELSALNTTLASQDADGEGASLLSLVGGALGSPSLPLQREESLLAEGLEVVDFLMYFLGYDSSKKYLLLGQNDDEIRATGGFIGVVVEMSVDQGELAGLRFIDSTSVDSPPYSASPDAPLPVYRYLWMSKFLFRDGNWNPHYPAAAAQVADLYQRGQGVQVDGVIAATEEVVLDLVEVFGDVTVPELPQVLDRRTAEQYIEGDLIYTCLPRHASPRAQRCFDEDLFEAVIGRILSPVASGSRQGVVDVLLDGLGSKSVLMHVFDQKAAELLWERNWNGALKQVGHDYLMIVDSSLPGHARSVVERRVQYQVRLAVGEPLDAELLMEYQHKGEIPDPNCRQARPQPTGCYWNYIRVYIPWDAQDLQAPPVPTHEGSEWLIWGYEPADSLSVVSSPRGGLSGFTEIGGYLPVEPQTSVTLPLRYTLPASKVRSLGAGVFQYRLLMQKQPGLPTEPVSLLVQLPPGAELVRTTPPDSRQEGEWVRLDVDLSGDTTFAVDFRMR